MLEDLDNTIESLLLKDFVYQTELDGEICYGLTVKGRAWLEGKGEVPSERWPTSRHTIYQLLGD